MKKFGTWLHGVICLLPRFMNNSSRQAVNLNGLPRGRIVEWRGLTPETASDRTLGVVARAQANGATVAFFDPAHSFDPHQARRLGVDVDRLLLSQSSSREETLSICEKLALSGAVAVIVIASVTALTPQVVLDGENDEASEKIERRVFTRSVRNFSRVLDRTGTTCLLVGDDAKGPREEWRAA